MKTTLVDQFVKGVNKKVVVELVAESERNSINNYMQVLAKIISLTTTPNDTLKLTAIRLAHVNNLPEILADALHEGYDQHMDQSARCVTERCKFKSYYL